MNQSVSLGTIQKALIRVGAQEVAVGIEIEDVVVAQGAVIEEGEEAEVGIDMMKEKVDQVGQKDKLYGTNHQKVMKISHQYNSKQ